MAYLLAFLLLKKTHTQKTEKQNTKNTMVWVSNLHKMWYIVYNEK